MSPVLESNEPLPELFGRKFLEWGVLFRRGLTKIAGYGKTNNMVRGIFISLLGSSLVFFFFFFFWAAR